MSNSYYPVAGQGTPEFRPASVPNNWIWNPTQMAWVDPNDPTGAQVAGGFGSGTNWNASYPWLNPSFSDIEMIRSEDPGARGKVYQTMLTADPRYSMMGADARNLIQSRLDPLQGRYYMQSLPEYFGGRGAEVGSFRDFLQSTAGGPQEGFAMPDPWGVDTWQSRVGNLVNQGLLPDASAYAGYADMSAEDQRGKRQGFLESSAYTAPIAGEGSPSRFDLLSDITPTEALSLARGMMGYGRAPGPANRWQDTAFNRQLAALDMASPGILQTPHHLITDLAMRGWNPATIYGSPGYTRT